MIIRNDTKEQLVVFDVTWSNALVKFGAILLLFMNIFVPSKAFAQTSGETWNKLDHQSKVGFVTGFKVGTWFASDISKLYSRKTSQELQKEKVILDYFNLMGETELNALISEIDCFYAEPANCKVTFPYAMIIVVKKMANDPEPEIQNILEQMRRDVDSLVMDRTEITKAK